MTLRTRLSPRARTVGLGLAAVALAAAGLVTSSLVSIGLWIGIIASGGVVNATAIVGAALGIAGWLGALFLAIRLGARILGETLTRRAETLLTGCIVGGVIVGALVRKALQLRRPDLLPPPEAYVWLMLALLPATAATLWVLHGTSKHEGRQ